MSECERHISDFAIGNFLGIYNVDEFPNDCKIKKWAKKNRFDEIIQAKVGDSFIANYQKIKKDGTEYDIKVYAARMNRGWVLMFNNGCKIDYENYKEGEKNDKKRT